MTETPKSARRTEDLSDADLIALRNAAISHGQPDAVVAGLERVIAERAKPNLYRHSRRR